VNAQPRHGTEWQNISKAEDKLGIKVEDILNLVAAGLENNI
jgi:hypothetical protein